MLLAAHALAVESGEQRILFLTDCDYEVTLGRLEMQPQLVVTQHTSIESDLIAVGALRDLVAEVILQSADNDDDLDAHTQQVLDRAVALAEPLGRLRRLSQSEGFPIDPQLRNPARLRVRGTCDVDIERLVNVVVGNRVPIVRTGRWTPSRDLEIPKASTFVMGRTLSAQ